MKPIAYLSTMIALLGSQAAALSCLQPDVAHTFDRAAQADEQYLILMGTFSFGDVPSSDTGNINNPRDVSVGSEFVGEYLTLEGFQAAPPLAVDIDFTCTAAWCGSMASDGATVLAFVEQTDAGYTLEVGPCGAHTFRDPTFAQVNQVLSCMKGERCEPLAR